MFLIDENVSELEVLRLRKAGIRVRLVGDDVASIGTLADKTLASKNLSFSFQCPLRILTARIGVEMTKTIQLDTEVPDNRQIKIVLPSEIPVGPAQLTVLIQTPSEPATSKLGDLLENGFYGLWRDRTDVGENLDFARRFRNESWRRGA